MRLSLIGQSVHYIQTACEALFCSEKHVKQLSGPKLFGTLVFATVTLGELLTHKIIAFGNQDTSLTIVANLMLPFTLVTLLDGCIIYYESFFLL